MYIKLNRILEVAITTFFQALIANCFAESVKGVVPCHQFPPSLSAPLVL